MDYDGANPTMDIKPGTRLGRFELEHCLGAGGMGEVYRARDTRLGRVVAIKVLPAHVASDPARRQRFEREARAIAALSHPHVCTLYEFDTVASAEGAPPRDVLVMELLEGDTLAERIRRAGPGGLPLAEALTIGVQIAEALAAAHRQGIVHRDLKPGNVMLTKVTGDVPHRVHVKLLDFGLAKLRSPTEEFMSAATTAAAPLTGAGAVLGTLPYMAPEQLEGRETDARADVFAFGAIVYEMVTGHRAFAGESQASLVTAIMSADPPSLISQVPGTPQALERVVRKCLAKDPASRWRDAADLADELRWIADDSRTGSLTPAPPVSTWSRRMMAAAATAGVGCVAAAVWWLTAASAPLLPPMRTIPLTSYPGEERAPALSPDGERVAFAWRGPTGEGPLKLYVQQVGGGEPLLIYQGAGDVDTPAWSPDGRQVAFTSHLDVPETEPADGVFLVSALGGPTRHLTTINGGHGLSWSPDGTLLAVSHGDLLDAAGGHLRPVGLDRRTSTPHRALGCAETRIPTRSFPPTD